MAKRDFTPDDVWKLRTATDPRVSPDGRLVAYVVGVPDRGTDEQHTRVWLAAADGSSPARPFSSGPKDSAPRWSPDGRGLAFVADRGDGAQVMLARLDGGEPRRLTSAAHGASQPAWSPDGRRLAFVARTGDWADPDERTALERNAPRVVTGLLNRFDGTGWYDSRRAHLFVVDVDGESAAVQVTDGDWDDADPDWSPDGRRLAFTSDRNDTRHDERHSDVWVTTVTGARRARRLTRGLGTAASPKWSPSGERIAYVGHELPDGDSARHTHLMVVDVAAGNGRSAPPRPVTAALDRNVIGAPRTPGGSHVWDGDHVLFLACDAGRLSVYRTATGTRVATPALVVGGERQVVALDLTAGTLAFSAAWTSDPSEVYAASADGREERAVSDVNAAARRELRWAPTRRVTHTAADGRPVESLVIGFPARAGSPPRPAVMSIHGGPHSWNPEVVMAPLFQSLASAGYVVVLPNPRGSHGYGEDWARACVGDWGGADFADLLGALDSLVASGAVDAGRCHVTGYSYGGFMTSWAVGHTDRFASACIAAPVTDLPSMWGTTDIPNFAETEIGSLPWEDPAAWASHSPVASAPSITTPVQLLHWEGDLRCPIGQAEELFQALKRLGREVVLVRYPGGYHIVRTPGQMADYVSRHLDWYAAHPGRRRNSRSSASRTRRSRATRP